MALPLHSRRGPERGTEAWGEPHVARPSARRKGLWRRGLDTLVIDGRGTVHLLRWTGVLVVLWCERLAFLLASLRCLPRERDGLGHAIHRQDHRYNHMLLTVLADPQLVDRFSYPHLDRLPWPLGGTAQFAVRWMSNTYVRKSFHAVVRTQGRARSDAVIWLGDLLDGGRRAVTTFDDVRAYERHVSRFRSTFPEVVPMVYLPGNHDVRIPLTHDPVFEAESADSLRRWRTTWGTWYDTKGARYALSVEQGSTSGKHVGSSYLNLPSFIHRRSLDWQRRAPVPTQEVGDRASAARRVAIWPAGGPSRTLIESDAWERRINARIPIYLNVNGSQPTHELALVDALQLAGLIPAGAANGVSRPGVEDHWLAQSNRQSGQSGTLNTRGAPSWYQDGVPRFQEVMQFVEESAMDPTTVSTPPTTRILFSHIPLYRPPGTACSQHSVALDPVENSTQRLITVDDRGWHREAWPRRDAIEQGVDQYATYQNNVAEPVSRWLLHRIQPQLVFSGDDHDHCHVRHAIPLSNSDVADEVTLKAFSMTGGVHTPGYARILLTWDATAQRSATVAIPCALPDQVAIWTVYYPLALTVLSLLLTVDRIWQLGRGLDRRMRDWWIRLPALPFDRTGRTNGFEARARREIRRMNLLSQPVQVERAWWREWIRIVLLPLCVWFWLQLF